VRFHLYDRSGRRVRYERVVEGADDPATSPDPAAVPAGRRHEQPVEGGGPVERDGTTTGAAPPPRGPEPIAWEDVLRGRENELGDIVMVSRQELERVRPQRSRTIDVEDFVDLADIDPVHFEKTYYAVPQSLEAATPYVLLHRAMREAGRVGIGRFVLRTKPHLVAVRPMEHVLAVETLFFGDEVRDPATLVPGLSSVEVAERELDLAVRLIDMLKTEWDPAAYADTYREDLLRLLAEKAPTTPVAAADPTAAADAEGPSAVEQLMAALRESVEAAKAKGDARRGTRSTAL
jgi:DNA end-binding protein Ku